MSASRRTDTTRVQVKVTVRWSVYCSDLIEKTTDDELACRDWPRWLSCTSNGDAPKVVITSKRLGSFQC